MSAPQDKKRKTGGSPGVVQRKRGPDQDVDVPTLGDVAAEADFEPLRQLLEPVMNRPVSKLGQTLRAKLEEKGGEELGLVLASFFDECDARAKAHKRARAASEELSPAAFMIDEFLEVPEGRRLSLEAEKNVDIPEVTTKQRDHLGRFLKFVNREESINVLLRHAACQYLMYLRGFQDKEAQFAACSGGPGLGKTTFCRKAFSKAVDEIDDGALLKAEQIRVTRCCLLRLLSGPDAVLRREVTYLVTVYAFGGQFGQQLWSGVPYSFAFVVNQCVESGRQYRISFGKDPLQQFEEQDAAKSFALRLAELCGADLEWDRVPRGDICLQQVIGRLTGGKRESLVVVNLDETNKLMETNAGKDYLVRLMSATRHCNAQRDVGFIYLTLSGTNVRQLHEAISSETGAPPKEIPLPLLEVKHMEEVLLEFATRQQDGREQGGVSLGQQLDFVLQVLGGVPRYLEMLVFLLGQQGGTFTSQRYCEKLRDPGSDAPRLLEGVKALILGQYGREFAEMLQGIPCDALMALSLFRWPVHRNLSIDGSSVQELETRGIVFLGPASHEKLTLQMPLVLMLFASASVGHRAGMLLKRFDVMLSSDESERNSLAVISLKCRGLTQLREPILLTRLLPLDLSVFRNLDATWAGKELVCDEYGLYEAVSRITFETWPMALEKLQDHGAFVVNCKGAPFADMIIVPKGGTFVIFLQEKQRERAKEQLLAEKTVPTLKLGDVQKEHAKCNLATPHLFVMITDESFKAYDELKSNEIVLPYDQHGALMGPLLALLRRFNHSNQNKIVVK